MKTEPLEVGHTRHCPRVLSPRVLSPRVPGLIGRPLATAALGVAISVASLSTMAQDITHGELAGAIRAAGKPCHQVIDVQAVSDSSWLVTCNSGGFSVSRDKAGQLNVSGAG